MKDFQEKVNQLQKEELHNEIMKLNCELTGVIHDIKNKATDTAEIYFLCSKYVNLQNGVFKLKKELEQPQDQEKKVEE